MTFSEPPNLPLIHVTRVIEKDGRKFTVPVTPEICDFCGDVDPKWDYGCEDFAIPEIRFGSAGEWAVCEECSQRIENGEWERLTSRQLTNAPKGLMGAAWKDRIQKIQAGFRKHRTGGRKEHVEG